jgi:chromosome partitioning protein
MNTIAIVSQKGGVAKTTLAATLAHALALMNRTVLAVDLDPQGQLAQALGREPGPATAHWLRGKPIADLAIEARPNLALIRADKTLQVAIDRALAAGLGHLDARLITRQLSKLRFHYAVLDTAPSATQLQAAAILAANLILIPARCDGLSPHAIAATVSTIQALHPGNPGPTTLVAPTFYDSRRNIDRQTLNSYREHLRAGCLAPIHTAAAIAAATAQGKTIFETAPHSRAADEMRQLAWTVRNHFERRRP